MTMARAHLVDPAVTRWYHCVTRCVRRAFLLGEGPLDRKEWIERRLQELAEIFALSVGGFSVMDNHLHVLVRLDPDTAAGWSDEEVVRRWGRLFPPRDKSRQPLPVSKAWVEWRLQDVQWVATARARLQSLSWFMKCLKEPLSRLANRQDNTRGAFFEGRFKSVAILDEESLLATCAYIDLNPVAAGIVEVPEASPHTSVSTRVEHVKAQGRASDLTAAKLAWFKTGSGTVAGTARRVLGTTVPDPLFEPVAGTARRVLGTTVPDPLFEPVAGTARRVLGTTVPDPVLNQAVAGTARTVLCATVLTRFEPGRKAWQCGRIDCSRRPGGINLALPDRRSPPA